MKQLSQGNESFLIQGFRLFCDAACNYGGCILSNSTHYHCNVCGFAVTQTEDCQTHKTTCPGPNFNALGRSYDPMYPPPTQSQSDCSTFYPMYGITQTTGPPTISPGAGAAPYYRTQPAVFSPFYTPTPNFDNFTGQSHDSWQRPLDARSVGSKESRSSMPSKPPAPSSCIFTQSLDSYTDTVDFMPRSNQQQSSRGSQKQLPSFEPALGFMTMGPEDGMYSPAPFTFHSIAGDTFVDKSSPFTVVDDLPSESCIPFPPIPSHQPPSCLLEPSAEDQDSDIGSDEHEIIVEETGEDQIPNIHRQSCAVCGELCGWSAVSIRKDLPVTLSSQTAVWTKLQQTMGPKVAGQLHEGAVICCNCLHLVNTVDQLQSQLVDTSNRLYERLKSPESELPERVHQDVAMLEKPERDLSEAGAMVPEPVAVEAAEAPLFEPAAPTYSDQPVFKCDTCGKEFASRRSISGHMRLHLGRVRVHFKLVCELCGKQFNHRNNLAAHAPVCSGKFKFHCGTCGKGFSLRTKLKVHEATHEGKFPLRCDICHKGFLKVSDLNVHKRTHSGEKPFICETCGKGFASVGNYNHHAKVHLKDRPFVCHICKKGFLRRGYLMVHLNRHDGRRPFQCDKCGKSFPDGSNLYHHKRLHEGYKPYTCPICNKALSSGLQAHIRTHTGVRPFACHKCGNAFTASNALKKHLKRHKD